MTTLNGTILCTGFEFGGTPGSTGILAINAQAAIQSDVVRSGMYSLKCQPTGSLRAIATQETSLGAQSPGLIGRTYLRVETAPTVDLVLFSHHSDTGLLGNDYRLGIGFNSSTEKFRPFLWKESTGTITWGTDGAAAPTGGWDRISYLLTFVGSDWKIEWNVSGVEQTSYTFTGLGNAGDFDFVTWGNNIGNNGAALFYFDDHVIVRNDGEVRPTYPIDDGHVSLLRVVGTGTHLNPDRYTDDEANSPPVNPHERINELPPSASSTGYLRQTTVDPSVPDKSYLEFTLSDLPSGNYVEVNGLVMRVGGINSASGPNDTSARIKHLFGEISLNLGNPPYGLSREWHTRGIPTSADISAQEVNDMVLQFGDSTDIVPDFQFHDFHAEVDWTGVLSSWDTLSTVASIDHDVLAGVEEDQHHTKVHYLDEQTHDGGLFYKIGVHPVMVTDADFTAPANGMVGVTYGTRPSKPPMRMFWVRAQGKWMGVEA